MDLRDRISAMTIRRNQFESVESMLRRFKKAAQKDGLFADMRRHEHAEKPSARRKRKSLAARARLRKHQGASA